ncbi:MAG: hypothetical protein JJ896_07610 [Rhodothermales bacterium]|nr:hypothetical protein [Rhodothermales bacterium]MBO6779505.1 hypothetical protein [Rhodothermales bacterium]
MWAGIYRGCLLALVVLGVAAGCGPEQEIQIQRTISEPIPPPVEPLVGLDRAQENGLTVEDFRTGLLHPDWVVLPADTGAFALFPGYTARYHFVNPDCGTVSVGLLEDGRWDLSGSHSCGPESYPPDRFRCSQPDRDAWCPQE